MQASFIDSPNTSKAVGRTQGTSSSETSTSSLFPILSVGNADETPFVEDTQTTSFLSKSILNKFQYTNVSGKLIRIFPVKQSIEIPSNSEASFVLDADTDLKDETEALLPTTIDHLVTATETELLQGSGSLSEELMLKSLLISIFKEGLSFSEQVLFTMYKEEHPSKEQYLAFTLSALKATRLCWKIKIRVNHLIYLVHEENYESGRVKMTKNSLHSELNELFTYFFHYYELFKELQPHKIQEKTIISAQEMNKINKDLITRIRSIQKQIKDIKRYYEQIQNKRQVTEEQLIQNMPLCLTEERIIQSIKNNFTSLSDNKINQIIKTIATSITKTQVSTIDNRFNSVLTREFWDLLALNTLKKSDFYIKFQQFFFSSWKTADSLSKQAKIDFAKAKNSDDYQAQCIITNARYFRKELKKQAVYLFYQMLKLVEAKINFQKKKESKFKFEQINALKTINETYKGLYVFVYLPYIARSKQQWTLLNQDQLAINREIKTLNDLLKKSEALNSRLYTLSYKNIVSYSSPKHLEFIDKMMTQLHQVGHITFDIFEAFFDRCALLDTSTSTSSNHQLNPKRHGDALSMLPKRRRGQKSQASASLSVALPEGAAYQTSSQASMLKFNLPQSESAREGESRQSSTMIHFATKEKGMEHNETRQARPSLTNTSFSSQFFEHEGLEEFFDILPSQSAEFESK